MLNIWSEIVFIFSFENDTALKRESNLNDKNVI